MVQLDPILYPYHNYVTEHGYRLIEVHNVVSYSYRMMDPEHHNLALLIQTSDPAEGQDNEDVATYLVVDSNDASAFGHFFYDCAIHLSCWSDMKRAHPTIRVYIQGEKDFKYLLLDYFGIPREDIVLQIEPGRNRCFFFPMITQYQKEIPDYFVRLLDEIVQGAPDVPEPSVDVLFLPRQSKENYVHNDRRFVNNEEMIGAILSMEGNNRVMHTDAVTDFAEQIRMVRSAKKLIMDWGSAFCVNAMFARNSEIIVYNNRGFHEKYPMVFYINQKVCSWNNRLYFVDGCSDAGGIDRRIHVSDLTRLLAQVGGDA